MKKAGKKRGQWAQAGRRGRVTAAAALILIAAIPGTSFGDTEAAAVLYPFPIVDRIAAPEVAINEAPPEATMVLSAADRRRYREIFALQKDGKWRAADKLIRQVEDDILLGHVRFQRYMHPTDYRSRFRELRDWLKAYADHPDARRVYTLAKRRQGKARNPRRPVPITFIGAKSSSAAPIAKPQPKPEKPVVRRSSKERKAAYALERRVKRELRRRKPERAEKRLWASLRAGTLTDGGFGTLMAKVAEAYFHAGRDDKAFALARFAVEQGGEAQPATAWMAGLAAWSRNDCETAAYHFSLAAVAPGAPASLTAASGVWGARAELACNRPERVSDLLRIAASTDGSFYGSIARQLMGFEPRFDGGAPLLEIETAADLMSRDELRRAVALVEVGRMELAEEEMRLSWIRYGGNGRRDAYLAFAARLGLPAMQLRLARGADGEVPKSVLYPLPEWAPAGGFAVDRALLFALIRQESEFRTRALSRAGARGLMQLMPATASYIARDRSLRWSNKRKLYEPELNLKLGQNYIEYLLDYDFTDGSLIKLLAAYNGGPGNLRRWQRAMNDELDPLLFIERLPVSETRNYVKRVMTNLWVYRARLGQPALSLEALASGAWPTYERIDIEGMDVALQELREREGRRLAENR